MTSFIVEDSGRSLWKVDVVDYLLDFTALSIDFPDGAHLASKKLVSESGQLLVDLFILV